MITRRQFLKATGVAGAGLLIPWRGSAFSDRNTGGSLAPVDPEIPDAPGHPAGDAQNRPTGRLTTTNRCPAVPAADPATGMPTTTVWSYGSVNHPGTFNYPAFTIEANYKQTGPGQVDQRPDGRQRQLPSPSPAGGPDAALGQPAGGRRGPGHAPDFASTPGPYTGPVPIVTHLHGGHSAQESDGYAEAWFLPAANNIPAGFAREGTWYESFNTEFQNKSGGFGIPAPRPSSMRTISGRPRSGITTTRWA